jgi:hypothetical protein
MFGVAIRCTIATANGLLPPSPSSAVWPCLAAYTTSVAPDTFTSPRPRPIERGPTLAPAVGGAATAMGAAVTRICGANGLSRQASSTTSLSFFAPSTTANTWSSGTASNWISRSTASLASTGMR